MSGWRAERRHGLWYAVKRVRDGSPEAVHGLTVRRRLQIPPDAARWQAEERVRALVARGRLE